MKKLILLLILSTPAFAEVPPPGTSRKGPITVTPEGQDTSEYDLSTYKVIPRSDSRKVQKMVDGLRKRIKDLENKLVDRRSLAVPVQVPYERVVTKTVEVEKKDNSHHSVGVYFGIAPDGVQVDKNDLSRKASIHENGTALGLSYDWKFAERWSVEAFGSVTTRSTYIPSAFIGPKYHW